MTARWALQPDEKPPPQLTVQEAKAIAEAVPAAHIPYDAVDLDGWFCLADGEPWPCLYMRQASPIIPARFRDDYDPSPEPIDRSIK